jgi:hypothetical protein
MMMAISAVKWAGMPDMREDANMQSCAEIAHELQKMDRDSSNANQQPWLDLTAALRA